MSKLTETRGMERGFLQVHLEFCYHTTVNVCLFDTGTWVRFIKIYFFFPQTNYNVIKHLFAFFCSSLDFGETNSVADGMRNCLIPPSEP